MKLRNAAAGITRLFIQFPEVDECHTNAFNSCQPNETDGISYEHIHIVNEANLHVNKITVTYWKHQGTPEGGDSIYIPSIKMHPVQGLSHKLEPYCMYHQRSLTASLRIISSQTVVIAICTFIHLIAPICIIRYGVGICNQQS